MRAIRTALSVAGITLATSGTAAASSGHYDSGHLAVLAVVGGAVALGSSALGGQLGSSAKRAASDGPRDGSAPQPEPASASAPATPSRPGAATKAAQGAADVLVRVAADGGPNAELLQSAYGLAKQTVTAPEAASGLADGVANLATTKLKDAIKQGADDGVAAAASEAAATGPLGTTARFCAGCGTPTREAARFCASCGRKLG